MGPGVAENVQTEEDMASGVIGDEVRTMGPNPVGDGTGVVEAGGSEKGNACEKILSSAVVSLGAAEAED